MNNDGSAPARPEPGTQVAWVAEGNGGERREMRGKDGNGRALGDTVQLLDAACKAFQCSAPQCSATGNSFPCCAILFHAVQFFSMLCNSFQCCSMLCNTSQWSRYSNFGFVSSLLVIDYASLGFSAYVDMEDCQGAGRSGSNCRQGRIA